MAVDWDLDEEPNEQPVVASPIEPVVSEPYATVNSIECLYCECTIVFADHDIGTMCDTIEGQYTEWDSVACESCGCHNAI